jgi:hypothetical protein
MVEKTKDSGLTYDLTTHTLYNKDGEVVDPRAMATPRPIPLPRTLSDARTKRILIKALSPYYK